MDKKVEEWIELKKDIQEKTKRCERLRKRIEDHMNEQNTTELKTDLYVVKKGERTKETVSKKTIPKAIWDKYKKEISYSALTVRKRRKQK
jgi:hypothetical protein